MTGIHWKHDRILLAIYLVALVGLLLLPIDTPDHVFLGVEIDTWAHVALFGGLAVFLRWNLSGVRHASALSVGIAAAIAAATEVAQSLTDYRSADWLDLVVGVLGALLGAIAMNRVLVSRAHDELIGLMVALIGAMISATFLLADVIGVSGNDYFGTAQLAGTILGALIGAGGIRIYLKAVRSR
jgi:uncharacterized membrane protein YeaQ/YmgE (transglycosylase-associated protein family)